MNQKSVRITSALTALTALAAAVVAVFAVSSSGILSAQSATTKIDLLNVGMCVTTDDSVFKESDCNDGDGNSAFTVGDRDEIVERETVYATYAHDPITGSERPRAILENSDLVKVTITDKGRDRRRSVLYPAANAGGDYGLLLTGDEGADVLERIKTLISGSSFAEKLTDEQNITGFSSSLESPTAYINLYQPRGGPEAVIEDSGTATLNFRRSTSEDFLPLSEDEENDVVIFFGFEVDEGTDAANDFVKSEVDTVTKIQALSDAALEDEDDGLKILGAGSSETLIPDEDRTSGGGDTPPWLTVLANVPNGKDLVIVAVLYETSDQEVILGGSKCDVYTKEEGEAEDDDDIEEGDCKPLQDQTNLNTRPVYTTAEFNNAQALIARVQGDNDQRAQNLYLKETGRFTGQYSGYIRITDANGDGPLTDDTGRTTGTPDWGYDFADGEAETIADATVIGVQSGPATITYKDSNGSTRSANIEIDIQPPTITIASPLHDSSGDDRSPDFIGTFEDGGSGLADDTFKLYVDNKSDGGPGNVGDQIKDTEPVLDLRVDNVRVRTGASGDRVSIPADYASTDSFASPFGVFNGRAGSGQNSIYFETTCSGSNCSPQASESDNDTHRKIVNADIYDDGDGQGTFDDDARIEGDPTNGREVAVDFQGVVIDLAGNIGFSDADTAAPTFINDLGADTADRKSPPQYHNVIGFYSRHVINLDDKDPEFEEANTITGYYGLNSDDEPVPHRRGIMITFDNDVSRETITANTFVVELDDGTNATIEDAATRGNRVFLRLTEDLGSSETPKISIAAGQRVEDPAGNQLHAREVDAFEAKDGVAPTLTVALSNGSGTGEGNEASTALTRNTIVVSVSSDEDLQGAPYVSVVCNNFTYAAALTTTPRLDVDDFVGARSGPLGTASPPETNGYVNPRCGTTSGQSLIVAQTQMYSRPGRNWEFTWRNLGGSNAVPEGSLKAVVFARDKSQYKLTPGAGVSNTYNWGSADADFTYDAKIKPLIDGSTIDTTAGTVSPTPNQDVTDNRETIWLNFTGENTKVTIDKFLLDGEDYTSRIESTQRNQFTYRPDSLNLGMHSIEIDARDAAGNETTFKYEFEVVTRSPFVVTLATGWNAISLPQQPVDGSLESALSNPAIDQVIAYIQPSADVDPQWRIAMRSEGGVWQSNYGEIPLTDLEAKYGYWVHSTGFVNQSIPLRSPQRASTDIPTVPIGITTFSGWNFVGVVDQDGDQTQNDWGQTLKHGDVVQNGKMYLGEYVRAYTWDTTRYAFDAVEPNDDIVIGDGIWVYYGEGVAP